MSGKITRKHFSVEEDEKLRAAVALYGEGNWRQIASHMGGRDGKQCKDRWENYLSPSLRRQTWTKEEEALLVEKVMMFGKKWKTLRNFFDGRSEIDLKNRFVLIARRKANEGDALADCISIIDAKTKKGKKAKPPSRAVAETANADVKTNTEKHNGNEEGVISPIFMDQSSSTDDEFDYLNDYGNMVVEAGITAPVPMIDYEEFLDIWQEISNDDVRVLREQIILSENNLHVEIKI